MSKFFQGRQQMHLFIHEHLQKCTHIEGVEQSEYLEKTTDSVFHIIVVKLGAQNVRVSCAV